MYKYIEEIKYLFLSTINGLYRAVPRISQPGARCIRAQYDLWPRLQYEVNRPVFRWGVLLHLKPRAGNVARTVFGRVTSLVTPFPVAMVTSLEFDLLATQMDQLTGSGKSFDTQFRATT